MISRELEAYSEELGGRRWLLVGTKLDAVADVDAARSRLAAVAESEGVRWCAVSAVTGDGVRALIGMLFEMCEDRERE